MRDITLIILHCTATNASQAVTAADITRWHKQQGFKTIGYHYVVRRDGTIEAGRPLAETGAHCKYHNTHSIGVCYVGGVDASGKAVDNRTNAQKAALRSLLETLHHAFPRAIILGHRDLNMWKECPCFDAAAEYADLQPKIQKPGYPVCQDVA